MSYWRKKNRFKLLGTALVLALLSLSLASAQQPLPTASWGLSFQQEGKPPVGNASPQALDRCDAKFLGDTSEKVIYLTFDAGFEAGYTPKLLDVLKAHDVPAAFFVVGNYLETRPDLVKRMAEEGHIVGNHTWHHYDMPRIADPSAFEKELRDVEVLYEQITGGPMPKYYRPPRGEYSEANLEMAKELGYKTVFWSLAYVDWYQDKQPTREQALSKLLPRTHNGAVILLHSTSKTNADILDELLTTWENEGYRFASLDELFETGTGE